MYHNLNNQLLLIVDCDMATTISNPSFDRFPAAHLATGKLVWKSLNEPVVDDIPQRRLVLLSEGKNLFSRISIITSNPVE